MKLNHISAAVILSALTATAALATEGADYAPIYLDKTAITLDAGYMMDIDGLTVDSLTGGSISMSYVFNRTDKSAHSIGLTFGYFEGDDDGELNDDTGIYELPEMADAVAFRQITYSASEKLSQEILPIIITYKYHRNITDSISCYAGARAGVYITKSEARRKSDYVELTGAVFGDSDPLIGVQTYSVKGYDSRTSVAPTFGLELGVEYQFAKNWSWHLDGSIDASFNVQRLKSLQEHSNDGLYAVENPEKSKGTAVSATIRTGFSYQF
ncbi:MAG: hypothetical protein Q4F40_07905 [Akkermansia sp.]|nr:hypothetical protein [Akkermansia sp.]